MHTYQRDIGESKMFQTKAECEAYIVANHGEDYLKFDIVVAQKITGMVAKYLGYRKDLFLDSILNNLLVILREFHNNN